MASFDGYSQQAASFDDHDEDEPFDSRMDEPTVYEYDAEAAAATKLQAIQRGHTGRAKAAARRADANGSRLTPPDAFA